MDLKRSSTRTFRCCLGTGRKRGSLPKCANRLSSIVFFSGRAPSQSNLNDSVEPAQANNNYQVNLSMEVVLREIILAMSDRLISILTGEKGFGLERNLNENSD